MPISSKSLAKTFLIAVVLLSAVVYFYNLTSQRSSEVDSGTHGTTLFAEEPRSSPSVADQPGAPRGAGPSSTSGGRDIDSDAEDTLQSALVAVYNANSALAMNDALDQLARFEPEYAEWRRMDLPDFCNPVAIEMQAGPKAPARERFCAGFDWQAYQGRSGRNTADIDLLDDFTNFEMRLEEEIAAELRVVPESKRSDVYTRLVREARFPEELYHLMFHNYRKASKEHAAKPLWEFGADLREALYPEADLVNAQNVALQLYGCRKFGGCARNQYLTMLNCITLLVGKCRADSTIEDVLYQTTPPADFNLAMEISARL